MKPAENIKRFAAFLIDCVIAMVLNLIPHLWFIGGTIYFLLRDGLGIPGLGKRSLGKCLMKLKVVSSKDGRELTAWQDSLRRNCLFIVPFFLLIEGLVLLRASDGRRLGDKIADSLVVEA